MQSDASTANATIDPPLHHPGSARRGVAGRRRFAFTVLAAAGIAALVLSDARLAASHSAPAEGRWIATWTAAAMAPGSALGTPRAFENQTVRQVVHLSVGGRQLRLRLSNEYGTAPLVIGAVQVAAHADGAAIVPGTSHAVTFDGRSSATVQTGAYVVSDPIDFNTGARADLAVSVFVPESTGLATYHDSGNQTAYISDPGDFTSEPALPFAETALSRYWLTTVEVVPADAADRIPGVVVIGDSIAEGFRSTLDANHRWTDYLSARANRRDSTLAVLNEAIGCSRLLHGFCGQSGLARFDRDVIAVSGATHVIVALGLVDLALPTVGGTTDDIVSAEDVIAGLKQLIARGHAKGIHVYGGTLTANEESTFPNFYTPENELKRQAINHWIRTSGAFDRVFDFDAALRDPSHPARLLHAYASDDFTHPNDAGYAAMASAVDLDAFR